MLSTLPGMPEHMISAIEHHKSLIEEAQRHREAKSARGGSMERPMRWRRFRRTVGELLINMGQRLKPASTDAAWG